MGIKPKSIAPFTKVIKKELILRDQLAADRTILANERTYLSFIRTALTLFAVGISLIKIFDSLDSRIYGFTFILVGVGLLVIGTIRYLEIRNNINQVKASEINLEFEKKSAISPFSPISALIKAITT